MKKHNSRAKVWGFLWQSEGKHLSSCPTKESEGEPQPEALSEWPLHCTAHWHIQRLWHIQIFVSGLATSASGCFFDLFITQFIQSLSELHYHYHSIKLKTSTIRTLLNATGAQMYTQNRWGPLSPVWPQKMEGQCDL